MKCIILRLNFETSITGKCFKFMCDKRWVSEKGRQELGKKIAFESVCIMSVTINIKTNSLRRWSIFIYILKSVIKKGML